MDKKEIAILMAAYNGERWIFDQILSIQDQIEVNVTIYVSLDRSTDNTILILNELTTRYKNLVILPSIYRFGSAAPNFFHLFNKVSFSNYDYIALVDQDDIWLPNKLYRAITELDFNKAHGYSSDVIAFWPNGKERIIKKSYPQRKYDHYFEGPGPGCTFVLTKELALSIQSHVKLHQKEISDIDWHDWFIYTYARHNGFSWIIDNTPLMRYRQHTNNQLGANSGLKSFINRVWSVINGYAIEQARVNVRALNRHLKFVDSWIQPGRKGIISILFHSMHCRRKILDVVFLAISCFCMLVLPNNWKKK